MSEAAFTAPEHQPDGRIAPASYRFTGSPATGWLVEREGRSHLELGPGYRLLRVSHCGVCATDLVRHHLPFPLPQVTGHEVVAYDDANRPCVVEINASHAARGAEACPCCRAGLSTHCPERLVLGIHDLPGGFAPWLLAPVHGVLPVPDVVSPATATLIEPLAAALHAVDTLALVTGDRVAVLGPRRLGSLVIAALAARRAERGAGYDILAVTSRPALQGLARTLGADDVLDAGAAAAMRGLAAVVVDTTGSPAGLALAARLATREVHVKSTTGQPALGLVRATELVVDELSLGPYHADTTGVAGTVVIGSTVPASFAAGVAARGWRLVTADEAVATPLGGADVAVVTSLAEIDAAIRPRPGVERGVVRPRGTILVADVGQPRDGVLAAVLDGQLRISTTRCGDFRAAIALLAGSALGQRLGELMVTDVLPSARLADAFAAAASPRSVKVVAVHPGGLL